MQIFMMRFLKLLLVVLFMGAGLNAGAQQRMNANDTITVYAEIYNGDTLESKYLETVVMISRMDEKAMSNVAKYNRLRNAVYVTYPYARRAGIVMNDINAKLDGVDVKSKRKDIINAREKDLRTQFAKPLSDLSVYQGKVLMKLINRETGNNCYEIIKEYKGGFTARVYQTVAFFFDSNLKQAYSPASNTDDALIEKFVMEVQRMHNYPEIRRTASL